MVTFEQANILMIVRAFPNASKSRIRELLEGRYGITVNSAFLSMVVDGLVDIRYLTSDKGLPAGFVVTNSGLTALKEFDQMVDTYRTVKSSL